LPRYESLRDRLPLLYRPDSDATVGPQLALGRDDLTEVRGDTAALRFTARTRGGSLVVDVAEPGPVRRLTLAPGRAPGAGYALEVYAVEDGGALGLKPLAVLAVADSVAGVGTVLPPTFALQLKQRSLLDLHLRSVAGVLERLNREATDVMQAHWFRFADRAPYNPYFLRSRALQHLGLPGAADPDVLRFPYIEDLGRLASLVSVTPWQEDASETVETYRQRIARIVALYRNGLGTVDALRSMTEAQLPVDIDAPPERRDRPFHVEEFAALATVELPVQPPGQPHDVVGPLMHWPVWNDGIAASAVTAQVQSPSEAELAQVDADGDALFAATVAPVLELYRGGVLRVGLAYRDTVPPGQTLHIRPAYSSWLALDAGVGVAQAVPGDDEADPTAPGPWSADAGAPGGAVSTLTTTSENALWAGVATGELWRRDGGGWTKALDGQPPIHCLAEDGHDLLLGTDGGLIRVFRFPDDGFTAQPEPDPGGRVVHALLQARDGTWWAATSKGLGRIGEGDAFEATPFDLELYALAEDASGAIYAGGLAGLVAYRPDADQWWWYSGESASDEDSEWIEFDPTDNTTYPTESKVFLPPVTAVRRARDGALWIGTETGLARYVARADDGVVAFRTLLEAFPDVCPGRVDSFVEDERGLLWICSDRGLLRYDGRDLFEFQPDSDTWLQLGRADSLYEPDADPVERGAWRFRRNGDVWERFDSSAASPDWKPFAGSVRTTEEQPVHAVAFTDSLAADVDGTAVEADRFVLRVKLDGDTRVVDGGIPALPRAAAGPSEWRYLSLEPEDATLPASRPAWTIEGRLLPAETTAPDPEPGRYDQGLPDPEDEQSEFDEAVFAFPPAARVTMEWAPRHPLSVLVRLGTRGPTDAIDPAALDRVFGGMKQVRPAGVRAVLAVDEKTVRKES
jgi:hypothetical protein